VQEISRRKSGSYYYLNTSGPIISIDVELDGTGREVTVGQ